MDSNNYEKKLERLSRAITEAILQSKNVKGAIQELQKDEIISAKSFMMLVMRMDSLADLVNSMQDTKTKSGKACRKRNDQFIDGKKLSRSEIEFYEYLAENFDETEWLKGNGLNLN